MSAIRRAAIYKLAKSAREIDLDVMEGVLRQDENGRWFVGEQSLTSWLARHEGETIVAAIGSLADERPVATRTCRTCGRDYSELECPHCRLNRIRLRGHA